MTTLFIDGEPRYFPDGPPGAFVPLAEVDALEAQIAALQAERDGLREALKPFAKVAGLSGFPVGIDVALWHRSSNVSEDDDVAITLADCIEARQALGNQT